LDAEAAAVKRQRAGSESEKAGSELEVNGDNYSESGNESREGSAASSSPVKEWTSKRLSLKEGMGHYATLKKYVISLCSSALDSYSAAGNQNLGCKLYFAKI
jgi:hypothetical protein